MVAHPANVVLRTLHHRILELRDGRQAPVAVTLDIGLSQHVHAVLVAEVVEHRVVGIVRGTYSIDIQALHAQNVLFNLLRSDGSSVDGREVMTIDTMEHHALAIDEQGAIGADAYLTEAYLATTTINDIALGVLQRQHEVVEVGRLSAPQLGSSDIHIEAQLSSHRGALLCNNTTIAHNAGLHSASAHSLGARQRNLHVGLGIDIGIIEVGGEEIVAYLTLGGRPQEAAAMDTREAPVVLTLEEGAAGEAIDLQGDGVVALHEIVGNLEF